MGPLRSLAFLAAAVSIGGLSSVGCVSKVIYDREVADATKAQADADAKQKDAAAQIQALQQQLRGELERLGKDVDKVLADRGTLAKALDDAKSRLDELRKAQAAAESRTLLFRDFGQRFKA